MPVLKLLRLGVDPSEVLNRLGVSAERWQEIVLACSQRVVAYEVEDEYRLALASAGSGSDVGAAAAGSQLHTLVRPAI